MITEKDLQEAIAECQGKKNPNASTCIMLAAFLTIKKEMFGDKEEKIEYSYATAPQVDEVTYYSDTEFGQAINGKNAEEIFEIIDDAMDALQVLHPPLYKSIMRKI